MKLTQDRINAEVALLIEMKPRIKTPTAFGEDNHAAVQAQIDALSEMLTESDCYDKEESGEWDERETSNAVEAVQWAEGESKDKPSDGWKPLMS